MVDLKLYLGDCLNKLKEIPNNSIDCIVTSPPYNKSFFGKQGAGVSKNWKGVTYNTYADNLPLDEYENWMIKLINCCIDKLKQNGSFFFNHKPIRHNNQVYTPYSFISRCNCKVYQEIIWDRKSSPNISNDYLMPTTERIWWLVKDKPNVYRKNLTKEFMGEVWNIKPEPTEEHPAPFPVKLPQNCILLSTKENDTVLDPFMGIGTTGMACINTNRNFIGIELDELYYNIAYDKLNFKNREYKLF